MMRSAVLIILFLMLSMPLFSIGEGEKSFSQGSSFHDKLSGDKFWYALKIEVMEQVKLNISTNIFVSSRSDGNLSRATFLMDVLYKEGGGYSLEIFIPNSYPSAKEHYFQIRFCSINLSKYHILNASDWMEGWAEGYVVYYLSPGTYYLVFISYAAQASINFWINSTGNVSFSTPIEGNKTFFYERHHFSGNVNIGWGKGLLMLNGVKNIKVENSLFAMFELQIEEGLSFVSYTTPSGDNIWRFQIHHNGFPIYMKGERNFYKPLLGGESGKWTFHASILSFTLMPTVPNLYLYGADVKLPD
ncbi:MAG: hypothetical protein J7L58_03525 [Thermoplasmata archaeon]|nr:hypothetical protein [Thermoplasmata archaeon]